MTAKWALKHLLCKPEDLSLYLRTHVNLGAIVHTCVKSAPLWGEGIQTAPPASLAYACMNNKRNSASNRTEARPTPEVVL